MSLTLIDHWQLPEALELIRALQPIMRDWNLHICLGGGVLNKGESNKDLDLFILPLGGKPEPNYQKAKEILETLWGKGEELFPDRENYDADILINGVPLRVTYTGPDYIVGVDNAAFDLVNTATTVVTTAEKPATTKRNDIYKGGAFKYDFGGLRIDVFFL